MSFCANCGSPLGAAQVRVWVDVLLLGFKIAATKDAHTTTVRVLQLFLCSLTTALRSSAAIAASRR